MLLQAKNVWVDGAFRPAGLLLENQKIKQVVPYGSGICDTDWGEARIVPGFIDQHTHGGYGFDVNDGDEAGLRRWLRRAPGEGITGLLPTTVTQSEQVLTGALQRVAKVADGAYDGAEILGIHLEGPYLSHTFKGAQPPEHILPADVEQFKRYQAAANGHLRLVTLAPEQDRDHRLCRHCAATGVKVNMGHTNATYEQAMLAVANGVSGATHTFNAMSRMEHKAPGAVGATLHSGSVYGEIIPDGVHSHFAAVGIFFACKGSSHAVVVTDSLLIKGGDRERYLFGGQEIMLKDTGDAAVLAANPQTLAGSVLRYNQGLRNLVEKAKVPFAAALNACTRNPARHLGLDGRKGRICAGYDADLVVLADDYAVEQTFCRGVECL